MCKWCIRLVKLDITLKICVCEGFLLANGCLLVYHASPPMHAGMGCSFLEPCIGWVQTMDGWIAPFLLRDRKIVWSCCFAEDFGTDHRRIKVWGPLRFERHRVSVMSVLTRWCHWEQVRSWPPICATAPQWWCWTAGVCDGRAHDGSPSQCWKTKTRRKKSVAEICTSSQ